MKTMKISLQKSQKRGIKYQTKDETNTKAYPLFLCSLFENEISPELQVSFFFHDSSKYSWDGDLKG